MLLKGEVVRLRHCAPLSSPTPNTTPKGRGACTADMSSGWADTVAYTNERSGYAARPHPHPYLHPPHPHPVVVISPKSQIALGSLPNVYSSTHVCSSYLSYDNPQPSTHRLTPESTQLFTASSAFTQHPDANAWESYKGESYKGESSSRGLAPEAAPFQPASEPFAGSPLQAEQGEESERAWLVAALASGKELPPVGQAPVVDTEAYADYVKLLSISETMHKSLARVAQRHLKTDDVDETMLRKKT